ncbi:hypothetical protein Pla175_27570 [Pirellulimonas nuda]|uniref:Uncharacterized protein n=1 Tax=Pirellulimonas nuda TaxID=2528009 RepID=A0A518DD11_9BACT|nr:hypothetical protein [Pirellulimonas nuda]QDU89368.1 hypothetical protein Pla175_27570 [Pirellulimonas nuda]
MVVLMLLGMLARIREMQVLVRWVTVHWDRLKEPLGFDRDAPPAPQRSAARSPAAASMTSSRRSTSGSGPA